MLDLDDDNKTIFTSDLDPAEKAAVASGEERGKKMAMLERPEHYGNIGSIARNRTQYVKNLAFALGDCVRCEHFNPEHDDVVGAHCKLPNNERCRG